MFHLKFEKAIFRVGRGVLLFAAEIQTMPLMLLYIIISVTG